MLSIVYKSKRGKKMSEQQGFTLVELIITIILIGILATTVAPKFFTAQGYQAYTYRADIINKIRAIQLRAMQQTSGVHCHQVLIKPKQIGLPDEDCTAAPATSDFSSDWQADTAGVEVEAGHAITFTAEQSRITFNALGQPDGDCGTNVNGCKITINGTETLTIKIESEGYIHAQ
jgi:MSHA pilin protein MshC